MKLLEILKFNIVFCVFFQWKKPENHFEGAQKLFKLNLEIKLTLMH